MDKVFIIAEAGDNHNGSYSLAIEMVDKAVEAGADCVKFQTFITEEIISRKAEKAEYQKKSTGIQETQFEMVKKLELSFEQFSRIKEYCDKKKIIFLSTPFDLISIDFLQSIKIPFWKIPSGEITNLPYLLKIAQTHKDIILSTGMAEVFEIAEAINILRNNGSGKIQLLHCNTEYPTPYSDVNLRAIHTLQEYFKVDVGYSDHTNGIEAAVAAVALGATTIEKHFTLDRGMEGPDHQASLEPPELKQMIQAIRNIEQALGNGEKTASPSEKKNLTIARKSIHARTKILKGELFTEQNICVKRPGNGISPMEWFHVIGMKAIQDFGEDEMIRL